MIKPLNIYPEKYDIYSGGFIVNRKTGRKLKTTLHKNGYERLTISVHGKITNLQIHRLLAQHFLDNHDQLAEVNHKNGIKSDNRLSNLEWCDKSYNTKHAYFIGLRASVKGENHPRAKLTNIDIKNIRKAFSKGNVTKRALGLTYSVHESQILHIINGKAWKHI